MAGREHTETIATARTPRGPLYRRYGAHEPKRLSRDGNYLIDVGPMQDSELYPPDASRLAEFAQ